VSDVRTAGPADHPWIVSTARELLGDEYQVHSRRQFGVLDGEVRTRAEAAGVTRIVVVTTDENVGAQAFCAATGFTLAETPGRRGRRVPPP